MQISSRGTEVKHGRAWRFRARAGGGLAACLLWAACAAGPMRLASRPGPARASEKPGPWGTTVAVYNPALFGPDLPLAKIIADRHLRLKAGKLRGALILVNKAQRRLELWAGRRMIKAYRVQLGWHAHGPKVRQGDQRTPEGAYVVCAHWPSTYDRGLWLSYPNAADARRGLETGLIGEKEYRDILDKLKTGSCPPMETKLGGAILIHGEMPGEAANAASRKEYQDWTDGCVAMFNPDVRELYEFVPDGAKVIIAANAAVTGPGPRPTR